MNLSTLSPSLVPAVEDCWNRIGVWGDGSCAELKSYGHCHNCPVFAAGGQKLLERSPPEEYIDEWTRRLSSDQSQETTQTLPALIFRLGEEWLALDVRRAVEVAPARPARRIPHRSDRLLTGLVNIRGELHLCISLHEMLGVEANPATSPASQQRLVVIEYQQQRWVFEADEVLGVGRLPAAHIHGTPATLSRGTQHFSSSLFRWEDKDVALLDEERLFPSLKRRIG